MATYTNESLEKINKRDMINIVLSLQSKLDEANNRVVQEVRKLSDAFLKLQSELAVSQQVNSLLSNRLTNMERQCWANAQCWAFPVKWVQMFWGESSQHFW